MKVKDLTGQQFFRLTAKYVSGKDMHNRRIWLCQCSCGKEKEVPSRHLVQGRIRSCGCLQSEIGRINGKNSAYKHSGELSHLYNHSLSAEDRMFDRRMVSGARQWRIAVYEKYNYTCDLCPQYGGRLIAHHLYSYNEYKERRYDLSNGVCLCWDHHHQFHMSLGGYRKSCTEKDYQLFKGGKA